MSDLYTQILNNPLSFVLVFFLSAVIIWLFIFIWKLIYNNDKIKDEFITIIAHKYRTPLTQVKWLCENLLASETDSFKKESLVNISESNENLIGLTTSLIEITDSGRSATAAYIFEELPICPLVHSVTDSFKEIFHTKNIFFSVMCNDDNVKCRLDKKRIEFVLQSLLENAKTYTPVGRNVEISVYQEHNKVIISVADNGIGIDHKDIHKIFTKFFRTKPAERIDTEGFGISLYLCKEIIKRHKGQINVSSPGLGQGARFEVVLNVI